MGQPAVAQHLANRALERLLPFLAQRGQAQHAEREGRAAPDLAIRHFGQLKAAAAKVDRDAVRVGDSREHAVTRRFGLFFARQQSDLEARLGGGGDEFGTVFGIAHRGGRDALQVFDLHMLGEQRVAAQRGQAARGILVGDPAVDREPAAQPRRDLFVKDHRGRARRSFIDDEADRVRSDVDDGGTMDRLF